MPNTRDAQPEMTGNNRSRQSNIDAAKKHQMEIASMRPKYMMPSHTRRCSGSKLVETNQLPK